MNFNLMNSKTIRDENEPVSMHHVNREMPRYYSSRERMHTMLVRKCVGQVSQYQTCLANNKWLLN